MHPDSERAFTCFDWERKGQLRHCSWSYVHMSNRRFLNTVPEGNWVILLLPLLSSGKVWVLDHTKISSYSSDFRDIWVLVVRLNINLFLKIACITLKKMVRSRFRSMVMVGNQTLTIPFIFLHGLFKKEKKNTSSMVDVIGLTVSVDQTKGIDFLRT